ncbi:hypothetical protein OROGR_027382 [Orobanche gracilis]
MSTTAFLLFIISAVLLPGVAPEEIPGHSPSVYEVLQSYDFPVGLLPQGVTSYHLNSSTGKFSVNLNKSCSFSIDSYDLKYKSAISGTISTDKIKDLKGIQVKVLLFWMNIVEVTNDGDELELSVGIASASFPLDSFCESPRCGCGFDCVKRNSRKFSLFRNVLPFSATVGTNK